MQVISLSDAWDTYSSPLARVVLYDRFNCDYDHSFTTNVDRWLFHVVCGIALELATPVHHHHRGIT